MINHNRYTLLNRQADEMYDYAFKKNIAILNAAPYAGGVLAKGPSNFKKITYQDASDEKLMPAREIEKVCKKHNVEIGAAALQFSLKVILSFNQKVLNSHNIVSTIQKRKLILGKKTVTFKLISYGYLIV